MKDFPRRLLGLIVAESLLLSPCLWGDGVGGDDARPQVHGVRGPVLEREESLDAGEPLGEGLSETLEGGEPWEGAVAGTALPVSLGDEGGGASLEPLASGVFDEAGGLLEHGALRLLLPSGALSRPVEIGIYSLGSTHEVPEGRQNVTDGAQAYRFLPAGLEFAVPVEISLPYDKNRESLHGHLTIDE